MGAQGHAAAAVAASLLTEGWALAGVAESYSGGRFAPGGLERNEYNALRPVENHTLDHPDMPDAVRFEVPDWLLPHLLARFGDDLPAEMAALGEPAPLDLRANLLKTTREDARAALAAEGWEAHPTPFSPWGLRIDGRRPVTSGPTFQSGQVEIQDEGSQLIALLTGAKPGMRVVDWCAGAGGKTLALAGMMGNRGQIAACDVSASRLEGAVRRLRRAGVTNVERHLVAPGDKWAKRRAGAFDRVLVDAPCTGTGTWRRNPDARHRLEARDLAELAVKQAAILDTARHPGEAGRMAGVRDLFPVARGERGPSGGVFATPWGVRGGAAGPGVARSSPRLRRGGGGVGADARAARHGRLLRRGAGAADAGGGGCRKAGCPRGGRRSSRCRRRARDLDPQGPARRRGGHRRRPRRGVAQHLSGDSAGRVSGETPEQIALYKAEIEQMFAQLDASEERREQQQKRINAYAAETQAILTALRERENDVETIHFLSLKSNAN